MAITMEALRGYLMEDGLDLYTDVKGQGCMVRLVPGYPIEVRLDEDGEYVRFMVRYLADLSDSKHVEAVRERLLQLNYEIKIMCLSVDPDDGEVVIETSMPVEDGTLTQQQVMRCFRVMVTSLHMYGDRIRRIIETGLWVDGEAEDELSRLLAKRDAGADGDDDDPDEDDD